MNKFMLHGEGLAVLAISLYLYYYFQFSWLVFILLLFIPDLSMAGYIKNAHIGAIIYNIFHTYILPVFLLIIYLLMKNDLLLMVSYIWFAHIGMDRLLGFGLKYPTQFNDTHLQRV